MVECFLAKEDVAGSTPVSRSNNLISTTYGSEDRLHTRFRCVSECGLGLFVCPGRGTQVVRERSAKPLCVGSIPTRASNIFNNLQGIRALSLLDCGGNCAEYFPLPGPAGRPLRHRVSRNSPQALRAIGGTILYDGSQASDVNVKLLHKDDAGTCGLSTAGVSGLVARSTLTTEAASAA